MPCEAAGQLFRREDHHCRERDLQRPPEELDRPAPRLRRRLSLARASVRALLRERLRPGHPRASPDDGGDGAAVRQVRRFRHGRHGRSSAAHGLPQRLVLAEAQRVHAVERHGPARARTPQRLREERPAARHADPRPALRRDDHPSRGPRLRAGHRVAHAAPRACARRRRAGCHPAPHPVRQRRSGRRRDARPVREGGPGGGAAARRPDARATSRGSALCAGHGGAPTPRPRAAPRARQHLQFSVHPAGRSPVGLVRDKREGDRMSIRPNRVKQRLAAGQVATILAGTNDSDMIDQLGPLGADGIWLEGEHGGVDYADLGNLTRACDLWGMTSVVRVMDNDYATIYRTLDRGAQGIVVPHVNSRAEAQMVVEAGKFAPLGKRGMFTSRQGFGVSDYLKTANDQSLLIVLLEDIVAVQNLDEILKVDHIDVFFVAPSDLATSMGHIGNTGQPEVQQTIDGAIKKIVESGRVAGTLVNTGNVERYTRMGVRMAMTSFFPFLQAGAKELIAISWAEADRIAEAVSKARTTFRITENFLYYPPIVKAKELLDAGVIGEPSLVRIHTTRAKDIVGATLTLDPEALVWRRDPGRNPGGALYDDGVHKYATAMYWIGDIGEISAIVGRGTDFLQETPSVAPFRFKDRNCLGIIDYTYAPEMPIRSRYYKADEFFEIHGSRGILWVTRCTGEMLDLPPVMLIQGTETTSYQVPMDWRTGFDGAARDFVDGVLEGRQPAQDVVTATKVLQVPLAIYEASRTRRPVAPDSMK